MNKNNENEVELNTLWKRLQKSAPDWKDIYDTYQLARKTTASEKNLKSQILVLFDYLVENFHKDMFNENALSACKVAVEVMERQRIQLELFVKINELHKEETDFVLNIDRTKLEDLVTKLKIISQK